MFVIGNEKVRSALKYAIPPLLATIVIVSAVVFNGSQSYVWASSSVALLSVLFFAVGYEKKKTGTRRMMISAAMIALSVIGRFIPVFKPVTALTVIGAVYLGPEAGFLIGSMSALISDFYFGLGPWTPFQMLAWGVIGLIAGVFPFRIAKSRPFMLVYSAISGVAFSMIMDTWTAIWITEGFSLAVYGAMLISSLPYMLLYVVSNVIFILLAAKPIGEKLERMKIKYGV